MSQVEFRNMKNKAQKKSSPKPKQDLKLSFRKLAANRDMQSLQVPGKPAAKTDSKSKANDKGNNRKGLYEESSLYLNQALSAIKNRKSFELEPGFRILEKMAKGDHRRDELFIMAIHLDDRYKYVIHHSVNVAIYALKMAEDLGFSKKQKLELAMAALLHDVGKTVIPLEILNKPGKLDDDEWKAIQEHPVEGARILLASGPRFALAATAAYEHHIGWTGKKGYPELHYARQPERLSRLIQVCDIYDALRTRRPFRPPWPLARTLHHLQKEMGEYLDPEFVTAFLTMIRQWEPLVLKQNALREEAAEPVPA